MITLINIPIYDRNLIIGSNCNTKEYVKWLKVNIETDKRLVKDVKKHFNDNRSYKASTLSIPSKGFLIHFRDTSCGVIAHEAFHITHAVLNTAGIKLSFKSDESFAYLLEYLVTEITQHLQG